MTWPETLLTGPQVVVDNWRANLVGTTYDRAVLVERSTASRETHFHEKDHSVALPVAMAGAVLIAAAKAQQGNNPAAPAQPAVQGQPAAAPARQLGSTAEEKSVLDASRGVCQGV